MLGLTFFSQTIVCEKSIKLLTHVYSLPSVELDIKQRNTDESNRAAKWQKLFNKHQQEYIRTRLEAIKHLQDGKTRPEVMNHLGCARQSLITWIDRYCQEGLKGLVTATKTKRVQRLGEGEKEELKKMLLEQKPTEYSIDRQIWTGKIIIEVIHARWGILPSRQKSIDNG